MTTVARLDDLRPNHRRAAAFTDQVGEVVATTVGEVAPAIACVEQAAAESSIVGCQYAVLRCSCASHLRGDSAGVSDRLSTTVR